MCCHAGLEDALIFVEIANSTSEMSPAFNLFLSGQYRTLAPRPTTFIKQRPSVPTVAMTPSSTEWDLSRLDGNLGVRKHNFNMNTF